MSLVNELYKNGDVVINIKGHQFGGLLKMGDLIANHLIQRLCMRLTF